VSDAARFEYEGPLSVSFTSEGYGEITMGDYKNRRSTYYFDGTDLAESVFDLIGGDEDKHLRDHAVKRVRIVVEVLDAEEHLAPEPPKGPGTPPGFEPPAPPEMT
jgi:hypothetical protein